MRQRLDVPAGFDGQLWHYRHQGRNAMHRHAELELNLVTAGHGLYLLKNRKYEIRRGDLLWLFPAQEHVLVDAAADFEMWVAVFKPAMVRRNATSAGAKILSEKNPAGGFCRRLAQPEFSRLEKLFSELNGQTVQTDLFNAGLAYALLSAWQFFAHAAEVPVRDVHPAVEKAARILRHESTLPSLAELAARAGLSPPRLSRLFKQQTGVALVDFRNRQRVEKFLEIYGMGQRRTMLDAALEAGFGSYAQFHRIFRRVTGHSPGEQRRK